MPDIQRIPNPEIWRDKEPGDTLEFGEYPISRDENEKAPIIWWVLAKEDNRLLGLSKYGLESWRYHQSKEPVTWERCWLRKELNSRFLEAAFTEEEQSFIPTVTVSADRNPSFLHTNPGNDTEDRIFLLSVLEAERYIHDAKIWECIPTKRAWPVKGNPPADFWWLRTPGYESNLAATAHNDGPLVHGMDTVCFPCVRPALWIDMSVSIFRPEAVLLSQSIRLGQKTQMKQQVSEGA